MEDDSIEEKFKHRAPYFTPEEIKVLVKCVYKYRHIIFKRQSSDMKEGAWTKIAQIFKNEDFKYERSVDSLKTKWDNLKKEAKKVSTNVFDAQNNQFDVTCQIVAMMNDIKNHSNDTLDDMSDESNDNHPILKENSHHKKQNRTWDDEEKLLDDTDDSTNDKGSRQRSLNFTDQEVESLISIIEKYKSVILNKCTNSATNQAKDRTWKKIAKLFNSQGGECKRSAENLKRKWENLKSQAKKIMKNPNEVMKYNDLGGVINQVVEMMNETDKYTTADSMILGANQTSGNEEENKTAKSKLKSFKDSDDNLTDNSDSDSNNEAISRNRSLNFTPRECRLLLQCVREEKGHIFSMEQSSKALTSKNRAWNRITETFNKSSPRRRSTKTLRTKFRNMKRAATKVNIKNFLHMGGAEKLTNESPQCVKSEPLFEPMMDLETADEGTNSPTHVPERVGSDHTDIMRDTLLTVLNSGSKIGPMNHSDPWSQPESQDVIRLKLELIKYQMDTARMERKRIEEALRAETADREFRAIETSLKLRTARLKAIAIEAKLGPAHPALRYTPEETRAEQYIMQHYGSDK